MKPRFIPYLDFMEYFRSDHAQMIGDCLSARLYYMHWDGFDRPPKWTRKRIEETDLLIHNLCGCRCEARKESSYTAKPEKER